MQAEEIGTLKKEVKTLSNHLSIEGKTTVRKELHPIMIELVRLWARLHILWLAIQAYKSIGDVRKAIKSFTHFRKQVAGGNGKRKFVWKNGKAWFGAYIPPFPSKSFDKYVLTELNRYVPHDLPVNTYQQINFAVTTRCPMRCEHCFEWDNLNMPETYSPEELKTLIGKLQQDGLAHISLSGGEPMVRFADCLELIRCFSKDTHFWLLTSGFNLTREKAIMLKNTGATGVMVSIDHFEPDVHNLFRGHKDAFFHASGALKAASEAGLMVVVSVCVTRNNANSDFLLKHAEMAASSGADFVQWLEPRAEGHYRNSDVLLQPRHVTAMEELYVQLNHDKRFKDYPLIIYHGFHQRRLGCQSGGRMSFYVDAAGLVHSCPFCHSHDFKLEDWLSLPMGDRAKITPCKEFEVPVAQGID